MNLDTNKLKQALNLDAADTIQPEAAAQLLGCLAKFAEIIEGTTRLHWYQGASNYITVAGRRPAEPDQPLRDRLKTYLLDKPQPSTDPSNTNPTTASLPAIENDLNRYAKILHSFARAVQEVAEQQGREFMRVYHPQTIEDGMPGKTTSFNKKSREADFWNKYKSIAGNIDETRIRDTVVAYAANFVLLELNHSGL